MKKLSLLILIVLLFVMGCSTPAPELVDMQATVDMAIQLTNTAILYATPTIAPTKTKEPTDTPQPTITPEPTLTRVSSESEEILTYSQEAIPYLEDITEGLDILSRMVTLLSENANLMFDGEYKSVLFGVLDKIHEHLSALVDVNPPSSMIRTNEYLKSGLFEFDLARSYFKSGLDNINPDDIESATAHMNLFSEYIILATSELKPK